MMPILQNLKLFYSTNIVMKAFVSVSMDHSSNLAVMTTHELITLLIFSVCWCSYALAIEFQEQVVDAWDSHGSSAEDELREARRTLEQLKRKARGTSKFEHSTKALPLPQSSTSSKTLQPDLPTRQQHQ